MSKIPKIKPIHQQLKRPVEKGSIGMARSHADAAAAKLKPIDYKISSPVNPNFFQRIKFTVQWLIKIVRENDLDYRKGELSFMYSIKWFYLYGVILLACAATALHSQYRKYVVMNLRIPELDERRKEFDPFLVSESSVSLESNDRVFVQDSRSREELREDSMFRS
eukprot:TRINITY_DN13718_c0_g1_i1.p1 TRINITY_DN13718_c0_g1~~TRINITY_DN13718_c0_g1_i1.p1  ORF type:complete len:165 (+),score=10.35 TRINITY_DN13718_c0_g1_i1:45-539(+)